MESARRTKEEKREEGVFEITPAKKSFRFSNQYKNNNNSNNNNKRRSASMSTHQNKDSGIHLISQPFFWTSLSLKGKERKNTKTKIRAAPQPVGVLKREKRGISFPKRIVGRTENRFQSLSRLLAGERCEDEV